MPSSSNRARTEQPTAHTHTRRTLPRTHTRGAERRASPRCGLQAPARAAWGEPSGVPAAPPGVGCPQTLLPGRGAARGHWHLRAAAAGGLPGTLPPAPRRCLPPARPLLSSPRLLRAPELPPGIALTLCYQQLYASLLSLFSFHCYSSIFYWFCLFVYLFACVTRDLSSNFRSVCYGNRSLGASPAFRESNRGFPKHF